MSDAIVRGYVLVSEYGVSEIRISEPESGPLRPKIGPGEIARRSENRSGQRPDRDRPTALWLSRAGKAGEEKPRDAERGGDCDRDVARHPYPLYGVYVVRS
ncbi:MAG: hypothetical protein O7B26_14115, partial [Planctomycetota bacterium]|nr:hypothetical protein [Planctomycetota bacterium]